METPSLWTDVSKRTDIDNIILELVGLTTIRLCSVADTAWDTLAQTIRQSMFRLKIIFDTQAAHFAQRQFSPSQTTDTAADDFGLGKNACFESAVYLTSLGSRLTPPDRIARQDYAQQRALALDAFVSSFRLLLLHREPLQFEQEDLLRERVAQLAEAWTRQQPLSALEDLVLNTIVPATLDELQGTDGNSCIQQLGCAKFSASSFERGRTPFCRDPTSPQLRGLALKSASQSLRSTLGGMADVNLLEAFWTLHDVTSAALATVVLSAEAGQGHPAAASSDRDLLDTVQAISSSLGNDTAKKAVGEYIGGTLSQLASSSCMIIPTRGATSDRLKRSLNAEAAEFASFLRARGDPPPLLEQQTSEADPAEVEILEDDDQLHQMRVEPLFHEQPERSRQVSPSPAQDPARNNIMASPSLSNASTSNVDARGSQPASPSPRQGMVVHNIASMSPSISEASTSIDARAPTPAASPFDDYSSLPKGPSPAPVFETNVSLHHPIHDGGVHENIPQQRQPTYEDSPQRGPGPAFETQTLQQAPPMYGGQGGFSQPTEVVFVPAEYAHMATLGTEHNQYVPYRPVQPSPQPPPESCPQDSAYSPTAESPARIPSYIDSGLQVAELQTDSRLPGPKHHPPPPPARQPTTRRETNLPEVHHGHHGPSANSPHGPSVVPPHSHSVEPPRDIPPRPLSPSAMSVATSSRTSFRKKFNVFGMFAAPKRKASDSIGASVPEDLQFRFSAAGTVLLLWPRRSPSHITKVAWPFHSATILDLYQQTDQNTIRRGGVVSVRLVEGGTNTVAVMVMSDKTSRLLYFDQGGHKSETGLGLPTSTATCLAVSRDDAIIAVGCGSVIHLYRILNGMPYLTNTVEPHSECAAFSSSSDQYRLQRVNFSPDSTMLVAATQEYSGTHKYPVYLRLWNCTGMEATLEQDPEPTALSLGYGDDKGLTSIFCAMDAIRPENSRLFLTAACNKSYTAILSLGGRRGRHKHLDLAEKRIDNAAQIGDVFAFKSGRHKLCVLDVPSGTVREIANFSADRADLKVQHDAMAVGMPSRSRVFAFWKSSSGALILKHVDLAENGGPAGMRTMDLRSVYLQGVNDLASPR